MLSLAAGIAKRAALAAMRMSQSIASPQPPPKQLPSIAAITAFGISKIASATDSTARVYAAPDFASWRALSNSPISAPAQKWPAAPVRITARTPSSRAASCSTAPSRCQSGIASALRFSGRFKVTTASGPSRVIRIADIGAAPSTCGAVLSFGRGRSKPRARRPRMGADLDVDKRQTLQEPAGADDRPPAVEKYLERPPHRHPADN